ncbi:response regulator [Pseudobacteriovorax antillogorgiicola]|nr:response regulator [Pseudobacteriovorax antillogorgiicola]
MKEVLVIDDDIDIMILICDILSTNNFVCQGLDSPQRALELGFDALSKFDLIFTDVKMPEVDGFEFIHHLRQMGVDAPVIAVTGLHDRGDSLLDRDDGRLRQKPNMIISKPFRFEDVLEAQHYL